LWLLDESADAVRKKAQHVLKPFWQICVEETFDLLYNKLYNKYRGGDSMIATSYSSVREHFKEYCDKATNDFETIIITRTRGENVVMLSESEYNNMLENLYVRSNQSDYLRLMESIDQLKAGKGKKRELIEVADE